MSAIFLLLILATASMQSSSDLTLKLSVDKSTFLFCENVLVQVELKNVGSNELDVIPPMPMLKDHFRFDVRNQEGKSFEYWGMVTGGGRSTLITIKAGQTLPKWYSITGWYGERDSAMYLFSYLHPGTYFVTAKYYLHEGNDSLTSNTLKVEIKEPQGSEILAFARWIEAIRSYGSSEYAARLGRFKDEFGQNAYRLGALAFHLDHYRLKGDDSTAELFLFDMIREYPNSIETSSEIAQFASRKDIRAKELLFRKIQQAFPGTLAATTAKRLSLLSRSRK